MNEFSTATDAPHGSESPSALRFYLGVLRRRRTAALLGGLIPIALAIAATLHETSLYQGSAQVAINRQNLANALTGTPDPTSQANDFLRVVQTQADIARSPVIAAAVVRQFPQARLTAQGFLSHSVATPLRDADLITFQVSDHDPKLALQLTNAYARQFTEYRRTLDTASIERAKAQIDARLAQLKGQNSPLESGLASKSLELQTLETLQTSNAVLTNTATKAAQIAPRTKRNIALGLIAGLLLAALFAWLRETLDTRVRRSDEIEERLGFPLLAEIPAPPPELKGELLMLGAPHGSNAEAFRILRTNLDFALVDRGMRTVMITSAVESEGKSTTIANLAVTLARGGRNVTLVDLDLRRPLLNRLLGVMPGPGITDVALGRVSLADAMIDVDIPGIDDHSNGRHLMQGTGRLQLLRTGSLPHDPGDFLNTQAVRDILAEAVAGADVVLLDTPPLLQAGDAGTLTGFVDAVLVVTRLKVVRRPMLDAMRRALGRGHARPLGFVVTGATADAAYGYGYYASAPPLLPEDPPEHDQPAVGVEARSS